MSLLEQRLWAGILVTGLVLNLALSFLAADRAERAWGAAERAAMSASSAEFLCSDS